MRSFYNLRSAITCGFLLLTVGANAQMVGGSAYLQGRFVEVGMNANASFGASTSPTTYHSHNTSGMGTPGGPLGFVADPDMDGWTVGTPAFMGDYFYPGSPFEGWEFQVDGMRCQAYNTGGGGTYTYAGGMPTITGTSLAYSTSGPNIIVTWHGILDSIDIIQETSLDTNTVYFKVKVTMTNTAVAPKNNIYYFRSVDPDNDETWPGGGFNTNNMIEHQMPDTFGASVVSALGYSSAMAYLAFGTTDTASRAVIYNSWGLTITQDLAAVYSGSPTIGGGTAYYDAGAYHPGDIGIGLVMSVPHLATVDSAGDSVYRTTTAYALHPANSTSFTYFYAFSHPALDSAVKNLKMTAPHIPTTAINNVNSTTAINVYPNPSRDIITITGLTTTDHLSLYDMMGREVTQNWNVTSNGTNTFHYNNLPAGAYILSVTDANGNVKARVSVRKQ
jgi:Secretion system C-terminal sorting domain